MSRITEVLDKKEANYVLPFFWQHGEEEAILRDYVQKIYQTGIKAICVESRPHPDFIGESWWRDLDIIISEAKKVDMKIWILDDSHFPTGYAVGEIEKHYPHFRKKFLKLHQQDFVGPKSNGRVMVSWAISGQSREHVMQVGVDPTADRRDHSSHSLDQVIAVVAAKKIDFKMIDPHSLIDITDQLTDGIVYWDFPEGEWRIFTIVQSINGGEKATEGYLNPMIPEATDILINKVYQAHFERYKDEFGKTIEGFFSDEPRFGNVKGPEASIGRLEMVLPWKEGMLNLLETEAKISIQELPLLWVNGGIRAHEVRYQYMNLITNLYNENFSGRIGKWCNDHGVEYIGHIIEDNNAHARLGYGPGHFFRSMAGQDMAGIDVVLHQILPGMDKGYNKSFTSTGWDGEFFHYGLAKLGASLGHLDPKKQGRTMCEMYGAYGWGEGLKLMKWLTDHMFVRGVNHFVPHAFSPKAFPDDDCPPHFYGRGHNPQYRYMSHLIHYMNRMSHLLTGGQHIAPVAILYHGEAEWSGQYMLFQKVARELMQSQIDFDVVPSDFIIDSQLDQDKLKINEETFKTLVVPYSESLPKALLEKLANAVRNGFSIYFIDGFPIRSSEGEDVRGLIEQLVKSTSTICVKLNQLVTDLFEHTIYDIRVSESQPYLRYYHYQHKELDIYMFFNEDPTKSIETKVTFNQLSQPYIYNAYNNTIYALTKRLDNDQQIIDLTLSPYQSVIYIFTDNHLGEIKTENEYTGLKPFEIMGEWTVSFATAEAYPNFTNAINITELIDLAQPDQFPDFSGTIRYETTFIYDREITSATQLIIEELYEIGQVWLNDNNIGVAIAPPYQFDISKALETGRNRLVIEVTNTLVNQQKDFLSQYLLLEGTGITGKITIVAK
ncbi:glycosyl hydrolase [Amphibacillus cookii]|uniref:glycosyl hydrolase n=1 Tax=Amphibacillus cookii TaxID=767787 RepID=UPI00195C0010|nr:glycosyl hydrolase [Amphibacillus cookii]MBM7540294.1 hypothetical protein [Amphibacillus cookii]